LIVQFEFIGGVRMLALCVGVEGHNESPEG